MFISVSWTQQEPVAEWTPVGWAQHSCVTVFCFEFVLLHTLLDNVIYALGIKFKIRNSIQLKYMSSFHIDSQTTHFFSGDTLGELRPFHKYSANNVIGFFSSSYPSFLPLNNVSM